MWVFFLYSFRSCFALSSQTAPVGFGQ